LRNIVAHLAERSHDLIVCAGRLGRIGEPEVDLVTAAAFLGHSRLDTTAH
jgi:hypothetical protein